MQAFLAGIWQSSCPSNCILGGAHRREVANEVRRTGDQLHPTRGQAADEVQLVALPPVAQGQR